MMYTSLLFDSQNFGEYSKQGAFANNTVINEANSYSEVDEIMCEGSKMKKT